MPGDVQTLHPCPQFARENWLDLRGTWEFAYDDGDLGLDARWHERDDLFTRTITVPFPPESPASGIGDTSFHPYVWYRRSIRLQRDNQGTRWLLHFGAVDYRAHVWVNGQLLAMHEGGQTPFCVDITPALKVEGDQVIVVRAEDLPSDVSQPRGKQDWREQPEGIWYQRTTGIWQPVWIEPVAPTHISSVRWTADIDRRAVGLTVEVTRASAPPVSIRVRLEIHDVVLADVVFPIEGDELHEEIPLGIAGLSLQDQEILWAPEHPNLIETMLTLTVDDTVVDVVQSYTGMRTVGVAGGSFLLNGDPYYLRLVLEQGYWPESHLAAPSNDALRREVELVKELGFNGVRIHQKVEDPRFLYWCDRLGLMVWGEMANAFVFTRSSERRLLQEWHDVVLRDYSHPCIIAWVPINESWGVPAIAAEPQQQNFVRSLYYLTRSLDPTRPVVANDGWEYVCGDILGIHDYSFEGLRLLERYGSAESLEHTVLQTRPGGKVIVLPGASYTGAVVVLSEFGGISLEPQTGDAWYGYGTCANTAVLHEKYLELLHGVHQCEALAGFCYTQLTDTGQETNGLLTENREPKLDPAFVRATTSTHPSPESHGDLPPANEILSA